MDRNSEAIEEIGGLTSGDWRGLGNYLWVLPLANSNWVEKRWEWATQWSTFMSRLCKLSKIIYFSRINLHVMLYEVYTLRVHECMDYKGHGDN